MLFIGAKIQASQNEKRATLPLFVLQQKRPYRLYS